MTPGAQLDVVVVGGSLAGLMSAIALARAGRRVTLLERATRLRPSGATLAVRERDLREILSNEQARAAITLAGRAEGGGDVPATWAGLYEGLCRVAEHQERLELRFETRVREIGGDRDGAWAALETGETLRADALVGADGHRSTVRRAVDPAHPDARFAGYALWLGVAAEDELPPSSDWPAYLDILDRDGHVLLGYPLEGITRAGEAAQRRLGWAWYDNTRNGLFCEAGAVRGGVAHHSLRGADLADGVRDGLIAEAGRLWPRPWRDAIVTTLRRLDFVGTPISEYVPERLVRDRLVLVGDAAHVPTPMTGRGFATSLDDAEALARHLRGVGPAGVADALAEYEAERLPPARRLVTSGQGFSH